MSPFVTRDGSPVDVVTRAQMTEIDRIAVEETGPSLLQMMENAGRSLAEVALSLTEPSLAARSVLVLAGSGGNGGGGICAARRLAGRVGSVDVVLIGSGQLSAAARAQLEIYRQGPGGELELSQAMAGREYDVVIDAMIGYGLRSAPAGAAAEAIDWMNEVDATTVSLDLPSGLDADTGVAEGPCVRADLTLTLHMPKPGLVSEHTGELHLADLGIPASVTERVGAVPPEYGRHFVTQLSRA